MNINLLLRKNIKKMKSYASARDEFEDFESPLIYLDANENPFENGINRYPDPKQKNVKSILSKIKKVAETKIFLGNGSDEVLDLLFRAFCEPNTDNVITLTPTYGMYKVLANLNAIENREVTLNQDFQPDVPNILKQIDTNTKIIFLCSPNNPTGNSFSEDCILELLNNFSGIVLLDEAYIDFSQKNSWSNQLDKFPNLVICQTLSKAYGMAGIRLGMLYASTEIITILNKIKPPYNVNLLTQQKAIDRLNNVSLIEDGVAEIKRERGVLFKEFLQISFIKKVYPSEANFILIKVDDAGLRYNQLIERGIVLRNRSSEILCEDTLRVTIGTPEENKIVINSLKNMQNG